MRARLIVHSVLYAVATASLACAPQTGAAPGNPPVPALTEPQAIDALKAMLTAHPEFRETYARVWREKSEWCTIDLVRGSYSFTMYQGGCGFSYDGGFFHRSGSWVASWPTLRSIGYYRK